MTLLDPVTAQPGFKWDERAARHLLNRAGFGVPPAAIKRLAAMKPEDAIAAFVDYERLPDVGPAVPSDLPSRFEYRDLRDKMKDLTEAERMKFRQEKQKEAKEALIQLQAWWIDRMTKSQRPLEEKLTLFWHGHFATSAEKVKDPRTNLDLNEVFRRNASGNFRTLVKAVGQSPAMLIYLDQQQSSRQKPNENWARELMELFTLSIGNYTETDIKEAARAFTGWRQQDGAFTNELRRHDDGIKTVLGKTGNFDGLQVIDIILQQPACAEFICRKLWKYFAYDDPEPEVITGLAETLRSSNYELKPVLRQMFSSQAFYQDKAVATMVKSPVQLVVNLIVQLDSPVPPRPPIGQFAMRAMGQSLFFPPNVKGWDGGRAWINTNSLLIRYNFANYLVSGVVPSFGGGGKGSRQITKLAGGKKGADMMAEDSPGMMSGGDSMMSEGNENETPSRDTPAGQDAMPRDIPSNTLYSALQERRAGALKTRTMSKAPFKAREFFKQYEGRNADEIINSLAAYFIGFPLEAAQHEKLKGVLAQAVPAGQPVPVSRMAEEDLRATIQLLLSTAEYQVC